MGPWLSLGGYAAHDALTTHHVVGVPLQRGAAEGEIDVLLGHAAKHLCPKPSRR